jgi:uncharacterized protein
MDENTQKKELESFLLDHGQDILASPKMQTEKLFLQHGNVSCFEHSVAVAYMSLRLANRFRIKVDYRSLVRGALLHDYFLYDWHVADRSHRLHGFRHARKALLNARADFILNAKEEDIIVKHMFPLTPSLPKYKESVLVILADKWCAFCETFAVFSVAPKVKALAAKL